MYMEEWLRDIFVWMRVTKHQTVESVELPHGLWGQISLATFRDNTTGYIIQIMHAGPDVFPNSGTPINMVFGTLEEARAGLRGAVNEVLLQQPESSNTTSTPRTRWTWFQVIPPSSEVTDEHKESLE